ncbi:uncharacterized protein UV8b_07203 [Ustilaginoidea virens]|uniref:Uncharacterized protein n=1 Tax=Ustilaginoidea virens TaxID=1159556 RepID=A0A8E5HWW6_USTVR|nr:uncharacterized protein UV8b_07203 [Ustilaginoidea virens]QUC22962.1 hypothetical protein UV8b_07203 [Ustilaginoidea virens]
MPHGPVKFRSTVVKPYNHDLDSDPAADDAEDIVYAEGPARPGRLEVRIPAAAAPPAAMIPTATTSSMIPAVATSSMIPAVATSSTPAAATYPSPATGSDQARPLSPSPARVVSDVMINEDQEEALVNTIASNTVIDVSFLTAKE